MLFQGPCSRATAADMTVVAELINLTLCKMQLRQQDHHTCKNLLLQRQNPAILFLGHPQNLNFANGLYLLF